MLSSAVSRQCSHSLFLPSPHPTSHPLSAWLLSVPEAVKLNTALFGAILFPLWSGWLIICPLYYWMAKEWAGHRVQPWGGRGSIRIYEKHWRGSSVCKVLTEQACRPEFNPQHPHKKKARHRAVKIALWIKAMAESWQPEFAILVPQRERKQLAPKLVLWPPHVHRGTCAHCSGLGEM